MIKVEGLAASAPESNHEILLAAALSREYDKPEVHQINLRSV